MAQAVIVVAQVVAAQTIKQLAVQIAVQLALAAVAYAMADTTNIKQDLRRDVTSRGTTDPCKIVYGTALVSGPMFYQNVAGAENEHLFTGICLAAHEVVSIGDVHIDDNVILSSNINWTTGDVTQSPYTGYALVYRGLGTATQTAPSVFTSYFPSDWDSTGQGKGIAYLIFGATLTDNSAENTWRGGYPQAIRALVTGKKVYDPRRDPSQTTVYDGLGAQSMYDDTSWEWSENPILCTMDYITDTKLGMGFSKTRFDMEQIAEDADYCDALVSIPDSGTQKRYTCNGTLLTTVDHKSNIAALLSSCNGRIRYAQGKFQIYAHRWVAPVAAAAIDTTWLRGDVSVKSGPEKSQRHNTIRVYYTDPEQEYKVVQTIDVTASSYVARDNGEVLLKEIQSPFTNNDYMAQRLALNLLQQTDEQKTIHLPCNYKATQIGIHQEATVTIPELGYADKIFRCIGWKFNDITDEGGVDLIMQEDSSGAYADPSPASYATKSGGVITYPTDFVPAPTGAAIKQTVGGIEVYWTMPEPSTAWSVVQVWVSTSNSRASAVKVAELRGSSYTYIPATTDDIYYFWIRAERDGVYSDWVPNTTTTTLQATAGGYVDFDSQNNRNANPISAPTISTSGAAVDASYTLNSLSSNVSFEWTWAYDEATIDGFFVYVYDSSSSSAHTMGSTPVAERKFTVPRDVRAIILYDVDATRYYTFGVQAYRVVDPDVAASGQIVSSISQPTISAENPFRPATSGSAGIAILNTITLNPTKYIFSVAYSTGAIQSLERFASDGWLTAGEKNQVLIEWDTVTAMYDEIITSAASVSVSYTSLTTVYDALGTYLNDGTAWNPGDATPLWLNGELALDQSIDPATFRAKWVDFYNAYQTLTTAINAVNINPGNPIDDDNRDDVLANNVITSIPEIDQNASPVAGSGYASWVVYTEIQLTRTGTANPARITWQFAVDYTSTDKIINIRLGKYDSTGTTLIRTLGNIQVDYEQEVIMGTNFDAYDDFGTYGYTYTYKLEAKLETTIEIITRLIGESWKK